MIPTRPDHGPIGLDVSSRHIAAAQLSSSGDLLAAVRFERQSKQTTVSIDEVHRIRDVLDRHGFMGNKIVVGIPDQNLLWSTASLPPRTSGAPIESLAHIELARNASLEPDAVESHCWELPPSARFAKQTQVISAGCSHAVATTFLDPFDQAGLQTIGLEPRPCVAATVCQSLAKSDDGIVALIEIGESSSSPQLLISGVPIYSRSTPEIGLDSLWLDIEHRLGLERESCEILIECLSDPLAFDIDVGTAMADIARLISKYLDTLSSEIRTALDYALYCFPERSTDRVILYGEGALLPGVKEHVGQQIGLTPLIATPKQLTRCPDFLAIAADDPGLVVALGLARLGDET